MFVMVGERSGGRPLLVVGLTHSELDGLKVGGVTMFDLGDHGWTLVRSASVEGRGQTDVMIKGGRSENEITRALGLPMIPMPKGPGDSTFCSFDNEITMLGPREKDEDE